MSCLLLVEELRLRWLLLRRCACSTRLRRCKSRCGVSALLAKGPVRKLRLDKEGGALDTHVNILVALVAELLVNRRGDRMGREVGSAR